MSVTLTQNSTPSSLITGEYNIVPLTNVDSTRAIEFLRRFYFRDEPLNAEKKICQREDDTCLELEKFSIDFIDEGFSFMATSFTGDILGVCLNGIHKRNEDDDSSSDSDEEDEFIHKNEKFAKILKLLIDVDKAANVFEKFPDVDKMLTLQILSVDGSWRGRGIAKALIERSSELCREKGLGMLRVDCTSHFSAKVVQRLGFECVYTIKYSDYIGEDGLPVFVPEPPHSGVKIYVQRVV